MAMLSPTLQSPDSSTFARFANDGNLILPKDITADFTFKVTLWHTGRLDTKGDLAMLKERNREDERLREKFPMISGEPTWLLYHIENLREQYARDGWEYELEIPDECRRHLYPSMIESYLILTRDKKGRKGKVTKEYITVPLSDGAAWGIWKPMDEYGQPIAKISIEDLLARDAKRIQEEKELAARLKEERLRSEAEEDGEVLDSEDDASDHTPGISPDVSPELSPELSPEIERPRRATSNYLSGYRSASEASASSAEFSPEIERTRRRVISKSSHGKKSSSSDPSFEAHPYTKTSGPKKSIMSLAANYAPDRSLRSRHVSNNSIESKKAVKANTPPNLRLKSKGVYIEIDNDDDDEDEEESGEDHDMNDDENVQEDSDEDMDVDREDKSDDDERESSPEPISRGRSRIRSQRRQVPDLLDSDDEILGLTSRANPRNRSRSASTESSELSDVEIEGQDLSDDENEASELFESDDDVLVQAENSARRGESHARRTQVHDRSDDEDEIRDFAVKPISGRVRNSRSLTSSDESEEEDEEEDIKVPVFNSKLRKARPSLSAKPRASRYESDDEANEVEDRLSPKSLRRLQSLSAAIQSTNFSDGEDEKDEEEALSDHFGIPPSLRKVRPGHKVKTAVSVSDSENEADDEDDEDDEDDQDDQDDELPDFNTKSRYSKHGRSAIIEISDDEEEESDDSPAPEPENKNSRSKARGRTVIELDDSEDEIDSGGGDGNNHEDDEIADENEYKDEEMGDVISEHQGGYEGEAVNDDGYARFDFRDLVSSPGHIGHRTSNQVTGSNEHRANPGTSSSRAIGDAYDNEVEMEDADADADGDDGIEVQVSQVEEEEEEEEWLDEFGFCYFCHFHELECVCYEEEVEDEPAVAGNEDDDEDYVV